MLIRPTLWLKIVLLAMLNVVALVFVFLIFARLQFRFDLNSALLASARARIVSVSSLLALQLPDTKPESWNKLLAEYSSKYPAKFYLFDHTGQELAGSPVVLPAMFLNEVKHDPFAHSRQSGPHSSRIGVSVAPPDWGDAAPGPPPEEDRGSRLPSGESPKRRERTDRFARDGTPHPRHGSMPPLSSVTPLRSLPDSPLAFFRTTNPVSYWVGVRIPIWRENADEPLHATLVWQIHSLWTERFFVDYQPWAVVVLLVVLISIVCWLPLIRGLTRTISHLTRATRQIADGQFEITLHLARRDELGRLSESINRMAHRLAGLVDGQKRFLSDIAHELSSPLARMQMGLGILEQHSTESDLEYLADVREEVEHMSGLVNELLAFSKSRLGEKRLQLQPVNISEVVDRVLARERSSTIVEVSIDRSITALAQPELLFRAIANVVRNALRYAGSSGPICISAMRSGGDVCLSVADNGPGLPESELENVFRPFYRPDFARQRETGGTGLGLAIVRDCIESCGGTVRCRNRDPHGLDVDIRLRGTQ